ncbi:GxxExxY protein [bacterium]|nr:GxxExxY protein [bacterium]
MTEASPLPPRTDELSAIIVDAALVVHSTLGPGLLESVYESCLLIELRNRGIRLLSQVVVPVFYAGQEIEAGFRIDLLVEDQVIIEVKAVEKLIPLHEAQLLTYMKLTQKRLGLLINFNVPLVKDGIKRLIL